MDYQVIWNHLLTDAQRKLIARMSHNQGVDILIIPDEWHELEARGFVICEFPFVHLTKLGRRIYEANVADESEGE